MKLHQLFLTTLTLPLAFACGGPIDETNQTGEEIVGGLNGGHPAVGLILYDRGGDTFRCTGTVISTRTVLTAAHCVPPGSTNHRIAFGTNPNMDRTFRARRVASHPRFNRRNVAAGFDVGVLILDRSPNVGRLKLPNRRLNNGDVGRNVIALGYGRQFSADRSPPRLRWAGLRVSNLRPTTFQAGNAGRTTCQGDSGGPHAIGDRIYGVTSFGPNRCETGAGTESRIDIPEVKNWLQNQILFQTW